MKIATTEAAKVKVLEEQLENLKSSSALEKQSALDNLTSEIQDKSKKEIESLRSSHEAELLNFGSIHEAEMSKLKSAHEEQIARLSGFKLREELREIKAGFERDKEDAVDQAVAAATSRIAKEAMELQQQLESVSSELTMVKAELKHYAEEIGKISILD